MCGVPTVGISSDVQDGRRGGCRRREVRAPAHIYMADFLF